MKNAHGLKLFLVLSLALLLVSGLVHTWYVARNELLGTRQLLLTFVRGAAFSLQSHDISSLTGTELDLCNPAYHKAAHLLGEMRESSGFARFVYVMRKKNDAVFFLVDSEPQDSPDFSPPGELYPETKVISLTFKTGREVVEGPIRDKYGNWLTAMAPLVNRDNGEVTDIVGVDMDVSHLAFVIFKRAVFSIIFMLLLSVTSLLIYFYIRRNEKNIERIRALENVSTESERKYLSVITNITEAYYRIDANGIIQDTSPSLCRLFGYESGEELVGGDIRRLWHDPGEREFFIAELNLTEGVRDVKFAGLRKDGSVFYASVSAHVIKNDEGDISGYEGIVRDVSEKKERELRYRRYNRLLTALVGSYSNDDPRTALNMLTELTAEAFEVAFSGVWFFDQQEGVARCVDLYDRKSGGHGTGYDLPLSELEDYIEIQRNGSVIAVHDLSVDFRAARLPREKLKKMSVVSVLDSPVFSEGGLRAMLSLWHTGDKRRWHPEEEQMMLTLSAYVSTIFETQERRKAELSLKESEERFRTIAEQVSDVLFVTDDKYAIRFISPSVEKVFGYRSDEMQGAVVMEYLEESERARAFENLSKIIALGTISQDVQYVMRRKDGSQFYGEVGATPIRSGGAISGIIGIIRDITGRREAEELMRRRDEMQRMLMKLGSEFVHVDLDRIDTAIDDALAAIGTYTGVERAFFFRYDFDTSSARCTHEWFSGSLHPYRHRLQGLALSRFSNMVCSHREGKTILLKEGGGDVQSEELGAYLRENNIQSVLTIPLMYEKECLGFVAFCMVFHQREWTPDELALLTVLAELYAKLEIQRRYENALIEARREAESASAYKSSFLASMSHEIRTPMNGVISMAELILRTPLDDEQRRYAEIISASGSHLLAIIDDLLDYSKIEAQKLELERVKFNLQSMIEDFIDTLALRAQEKGLELVYAVDDDVPLSLLGDPYRLRQVLINLIGNAVKFTERGEVFLHVSKTCGNEHTAELMFEVTDTGIGIPDEKLSMLFNPFVQVDTPGARKAGGTGLGLAISQRIVNLMRGEIGVESVEGRGSTFRFRVPFEEAQSHEVDEDPSGLLKGQSVLVFDGNERSASSIAGMLNGSGAETVIAKGIDDALDMIEKARKAETPFTIGIVDYSVGCEGTGAGGLSAGRIIKKDPSNSSLSLVLTHPMRHRVTDSDMESCGYAARVTRPVKKSELITVMRAVIAHRKERTDVPVPLNREAFRSDAREPKPYRILLVEDNDINREVAMSIMKSLGYPAEAVESGSRAIEALSAGEYDLVLMDCQMPGMDGFATTEMIRRPDSTVKNHAIPVIAMTASAMRGDRERCIESGMNDYLSKPIKMKKLDAALRKWLDGKESPGCATVPEGIYVGPPPVAEHEKRLFNPGPLEDRLKLDRKLVDVILPMFFDTIPETIEGLRAAIREGNQKTSRRLAHSMKGASAQMGATGMCNIAARLEEFAVQGKLAEIEKLLPEFNATSEKTFSLMTQWRESIGKEC